MTTMDHHQMTFDIISHSWDWFDKMNIVDGEMIYDETHITKDDYVNFVEKTQRENTK